MGALTRHCRLLCLDPDLAFLTSMTRTLTFLASNRGLHSLFALTVLLALAETSSAEIYVSNRGTSEILVFADDADGNVPPLRRVGGSLTQITQGTLNGIALDVRNSEIFVSLASNRILVFDMLADGNVAPLRTINGPSTGLAFPAGVAVDILNDELYVANSAGDGLLVFDRTASGNTAPLRAITGGATGINQPTAVFVDLDADEVFITNEANVTGVSVFPRLGQGNLAPLRVIMGPATTFVLTVGTFTNPATGEQLVADLAADRVLTFPAGASGNVAPTRVLNSNALASAAGITLTNDGQMLVGDLSGDGVLGFDVEASGTVQPNRELRGALTRIDVPIYVVSDESPFPGAVFTTAPLASVAIRNAGSNPMSYSAGGLPILGEGLDLTVDLTLTGDTSAILLFSTVIANQTLAGGQVLLVGNPIRRSFGPFAGPVVNITLPLPAFPPLAGVTLFSQAMHLSAGPGFALSNAVDLTLGF